jgi:hypothetical protein
VEVNIITGFPRGQTYGIAHLQSSSIIFVATSSVIVTDDPANERAIDFAMISSFHLIPARRA